MSTIISLTFDDGFESHLDIAVPLLNQCGLLGTFYVDFLSTTMGDRGGDWRRVALSGHELGNHSLFHPGYGPASHISSGNDLAHYTLERMQLELQVANKMLGTLDGRTERTFAYPSGNPVLGDIGYVKRFLRLIGWHRTRLDTWVNLLQIDFGSTMQNYTSVVRPMFRAARGRMPTVWPTEYDRHFVPSYNTDGKTLEDLRAFVERMVAQGTWGVFTFHRIGKRDPRGVDRREFEQFVTELAGDSRITVKTFLDASHDLWPNGNETEAISQTLRLPGRPVEGSLVNVGTC